MKTILITGASSGIGRATAEAFLADGWNVTLLARRRALLAEVASGQSNALIQDADVTDLSQVEEAVARWSGVSVDRDAVLVEGVDPDWVTEEGGLRLRPDYWADRGGMDGFYMALLRKA